MPSDRYETQKKAAFRLLRQGCTAASASRHKDVQVRPATVRRWAAVEGIQLHYPYNRHQARTDLVDTAEIVRLRKRRLGNRAFFTIKEIAAMCECSQSYVKQIVATARRECKL